MSKHINEGFESTMYSAKEYMGKHDAPDWEKLLDNFGNPTWKQRAAYYKKAIANGITFIGSTNLLIFLPSNLAWIGIVVAGIGWLVGVQVKNADAPPVKDKTAWGAAAVPPPAPEGAVPPTEDTITEAPDPVEPELSEETATRLVEIEDVVDDEHRS